MIASAIPMISPQNTIERRSELRVVIGILLIAAIREVPSLTWRPVLHLSGSRWWGGQQLQLVASPRANLQIAQTGGPSQGHPTPKERRVHWGQRRCGKAVLLGNHWPGG